MLSLSDLDQIEAQLDSTVPYYVPELVSSHRAALTAASDREAALQEKLNDAELALSTQGAALATKDVEIARLTAERDNLLMRMSVSWEQRAADANAALAAERQKGQALVEKLLEMRKHTAKAIEHRHGYPKGDPFGDGLVQGHMNHLSALDALGLSPTEPTPKQVKCPACGDTVTVHFDGDDCSSCGEQLRKPTEPTP